MADFKFSPCLGTCLSVQQRPRHYHKFFSCSLEEIKGKNVFFRDAGKIENRDISNLDAKS